MTKTTSLSLLKLRTPDREPEPLAKVITTQAPPTLSKRDAASLQKLIDAAVAKALEPLWADVRQLRSTAPISPAVSIPTAPGYLNGHAHH